ncbi:hypothetical protein HDZ31DRAFT_43712 [Schizophyllum fasciatum]
MHIILTGATGTVGLPVLRVLLADPTVTRVTALARKTFDAKDSDGKAGSHSRSTYDPSKLEIIIHSDFASYPPELLERLRGAHAAIWAQGISQTEVPKPEYERITIEYPLAAARAFAGLSGDSQPFTFVYVSGQLAMTSEFTPVYFARVKGRAERLLTELAATQPTKLRVLHVRPGIVEVPKRHRPAAPGVRNAELVLSPIFRFFAPGLLSPVGMVANVLTDLAVRAGEGREGKKGPESGTTVTSPQIKRWNTVRQTLGMGV